MVGGKFELGRKWAVEVLTTGIIFGRMRASEEENMILPNAKIHVCGNMPGAHAVRAWLGRSL